MLSVCVGEMSVGQSVFDENSRHLAVPSRQSQRGEGEFETLKAKPEGTLPIDQCTVQTNLDERKRKNGKLLLKDELEKTFFPS